MKLRHKGLEGALVFQMTHQITYIEERTECDMHLNTIRERRFEIITSFADGYSVFHGKERQSEYSQKSERFRWSFDFT
jgi:hypothetical protein